MSDSHTIVRLLRELSRRRRANRLLQVATDWFGASLLAALALALWNATMPRGWAVSGWWVLAAAVAALVAVMVRAGAPTPLWRSAARADRGARLHDELQSAYWFVRHRGEDEWVDLHVSRAASTADALESARLVPWQQPRRLAMMVVGLVGLLLVSLLPVPRVFETVIERLAESRETTELDALGDEPVAELPEATGEGERPDAEALEEEQQLLLPEMEGEEQEGESALQEEGEAGDEQPEPEDSFMEGEEGEGEEGEEGQQMQVDNPEDLPADAEGEPEADPNASQQEGQGESAEESGTMLPAGDEVFLQEGGEEMQQQELGEEEVGHATRDGGMEQDLDPGELSTLQVELEREILALPEPEEPEVPEEPEELITRSEQSRLDFQSVELPSEFALQELLHSEAVPWRYRQLVARYFKALRARDNQKEEERR